jgi:hypothetical protein
MPAKAESSGKRDEAGSSSVGGGGVDTGRQPLDEQRKSEKGKVKVIPIRYGETISDDEICFGHHPRYEVME